MKKKLLILISLIYSQSLFSQGDHNSTSISFDSSWGLDHVLLDTLNPDNIWHIGIPNKMIFDSTSSKGIYTDTNIYYRSNDTSSFYVLHEAHNYDVSVLAGISFDYRMDSDSLNDFGTVELSIDSGKSWINVYTSPHFYNIIPLKPLTGNIHSVARHELTCNYSGLNVEDGEVIIYKFTFISDSVNNNREGWIIDNIVAYDISTGIAENTFNMNVTAYPNPAVDYLILDTDDPVDRKYDILIFDMYGKVSASFQNKSLSKARLNIESLTPGIYYFTVRNESSSKTGGGRFTITR